MTTHTHPTRRSFLARSATAIVAAPLGKVLRGVPSPEQAAGNTVHLGAATGTHAGVRVVWTSTPSAPQAGAPVTFSYRLIDVPSGRALTQLPLVHERPMHLIVVRKDLTRFQHIHPQLAADGTWRVRTTLSPAGTYLLFDEFAYNGQTELDRREVVIGQASGRARLTPDVRPKTVGGVTVTLTVPPTIRVAREARWTYRLSRGGHPVTDLTPYLGAAAHVAIVSQDTRAFVHTRGEVPGAAAMGGMDMGGMDMSAPPARFGPAVEVRHTFAHAGLYKMWAQFGYHGRVLTAAFVVQVR